MPKPNFNYAVTVQSIHEVLQSGLKLSLKAITSSGISLILIFCYLLISILLAQYPLQNQFDFYVRIAFEIVLTTFVVAFTCLQIQAYADGYKQSFLEIFATLVRLSSKLFFCQFLAFVLLLFTSLISPFLTLFFVLPLLILIPTSLFDQGNSLDALKQSWRYVAGSRFFLIYGFMLAFVFVKIAKLILLFYLAKIMNLFFATLIMLLFLTLTSFYFVALALVFLHNAMLRRAEKVAAKAQAD